MHVDHPRFASPNVALVYEALNAGRETARIVGGAVRNALLGRDVTDIDFATTTAPAETVRRAEDIGFRTVPTGIEHGTVLLIAPDGVETFEVTSLREDVETDGRHAVVRFGRDWVADAARRDFTMNALYRDADGALFDPLNGLEDALARRVRFIGSPERRIREDALRILRFFRFGAQYGDGGFDEEALCACATLKGLIVGLSGERIQAELFKTLAAPQAASALRRMAEAAVLDAALGSTASLDAASRLAQDGGHDPRLVLAALIKDVSHADAVADRLALSNADRTVLRRAIEDAVGLTSGPFDLRERLYRLGPDRMKAALDLARALDPARPLPKVSAVADLKTPVLGVSGRDVLAAGLRPGPQVGAVLKAVEDRWIAAGFPGEAEVRDMLAREVASRADP